MIIEHPERLGLAQLHQLRGRIGRDGKGGTCILVSQERPAEKTTERLKTLAECDNGFEIAKKDMELRGHGEITGIRQSGFREFEIYDILDHHELFKRTADMANNIFRSDPDLQSPEHRHIRTTLALSSDITS
jgi:ATP-dependent DNA helicase RecG